MGGALDRSIQATNKKGDVGDYDAIGRGLSASLSTRSVSGYEGLRAPSKVLHLKLLWSTPEGQEHIKRYDYSVVRVTDGTTAIAVAALQLEKFAPKPPELLTAFLDHKGLTFHLRKQDKAPAGAGRLSEYAYN